VERVRAELTECYAFARAAPTEDPAAVARRLAAHYAAYYDYEAARGVTYGPEDLAGQPRFEAVARLLATLPPGARVLDYGCAHGHYTVNLARRFPHLRLLGVDLVPRNIDAARAWAAAEGLREGIDGDAAAPFETRAARAPQERGNASRAGGGTEDAADPTHAPGRVAFRVGSMEQGVLRADERFACVLAAEVLEHVPDPAALAAALAAHLEPGGRMVVTTPYGPWEAQGYAAHHPWRAHLHHLERADLETLFGHHPGFACEAVPAGTTAWGEALGSWLTTWRAPAAGDPAREATPARGRIDLPAKLRRQRPRETLTVCMVVAPQGETLGRCLASVAPIADEIVLGIDAGARPERHRPERHRPAQGGRAWELAEAHGAAAFALASPLQTGFAAARNATLERAHGDWVLWIDDDEELLWPERLPKYLRDNLYDAYALAQHHFAVEPGGVIKTDYPCRLFRRGRGFSFHGVVHEHPERGYNGGAGAVLLLPDVAICHNGYLTEDVRRRRFARNLPLMQRDRAAHPDRILGRFLWIRDLAHLNRFEAEQTGGGSPLAPMGGVTAAMRARAEEAVALWRGLLAEGHTRLAVDALPYTSEAARLLAGPGAIDVELGLALHRLGLGDATHAPPPIQGTFLAQADVEALTAALLREKLGAVTGKYV
jgi:2-polyprenyl-3-methyl-5-hydroxy-6-metoxy-1,4-benzoquinol methylase